MPALVLIHVLAEAVVAAFPAFLSHLQEHASQLRVGGNGSDESTG
jgi:hypothetical protein